MKETTARVILLITLLRISEFGGVTFTSTQLINVAAATSPISDHSCPPSAVEIQNFSSRSHDLVRKHASTRGLHACAHDRLEWNGYSLQLSPPSSSASLSSVSKCTFPFGVLTLNCSQKGLWMISMISLFFLNKSQPFISVLCSISYLMFLKDYLAAL